MPANGWCRQAEARVLVGEAAGKAANYTTPADQMDIGLDDGNNEDLQQSQ